MSSSLSSVVSNLVRASMGASISSMVTDDDLDRHVAELIVKDAKKKAERYGQQGIRAYLSSNLTESNPPRANKRFLSSIIKSTDDHNKTVLKAQAAAAQEIKREREEQERRERRARAAEAAEAERLRRRSKRKRDWDSGDESWDRWDGRTADRKRSSTYWDYDNDDRSRHRRRRRTGDHSKSRSRERREDTSSRSSPAKHDTSSSKRRKTRHSRSASPPRKASRGESSHRQDDDSRASHRHRHRHRSRTERRKRSRSPTRSRSPQRRRERRRSPKYALDDLLDDESLSSRSSSTPLSSERQLRERRSSTPSTSNCYPTPIREYETSSKDIDPISSTSRHSSPSFRVPSRPSSPSPGPQPPIQLPSKMDRYFEESYDPRLDVAPLSAPKVPKTGLISSAEFESWDAMLELIRIRRGDKEEKKRMERLGLSKEKVKVKKNIPITSSAVVAAKTSEGISILDIEYKKRGSVREWDVGKEGF